MNVIRHRSSLRPWVRVIALLTAISGAGQMLAPHIVLELLQSDTRNASTHFFRIVGMFMLLFGVLGWRICPRSGITEIVGLKICAWQKLGAAAAVGLGVAQEVFSNLALGVAGFDLVSGILYFVLVSSLRPARSEPDLQSQANTV